MKEPIDQLRDVHSIQGRDGCWDIDDYMLGLFNGLELALSIMEQREVKYKTRKEPKREWVGLTEQEIKYIEATTTCLGNESWLRNLTRNLEAKLKEKNAAIVVTEEKLWPVQVSIEEFMMRAEQDPDLVGRPVIWTQWPKEKK